jgi:MoxR-like ATPase
MTNVNPSQVRRATALHAVEQLAALMAAEATAPAMDRDAVRAEVRAVIEDLTADARRALDNVLPHARPDALGASDKYTRTPTCEALDAALKVMDVDGTRCVIMSGPSGSSKTFAARHAAARRGRPVYTVECSAATTREDLLDRPWTGTEAGRLAFVEGAVARAMRDGGTLILDEFDLVHASVVGALHSVLDRDASARLLSGEQLVAHPAFRVVLTCNGLRRDSGGNYSVQTISTALKGRALFIAADYLPEDVEVQLYAAHGYDERSAKWALAHLVEARALFKCGAHDVPPSPRMGLRVLAALKAGLQPEQAWGLALIDALPVKAAGQVRERFAALKATGVTL